MPLHNDNLLIKTYVQVDFLRMWFANNKVDKFTVSVWFKRQGEQLTPQGIVNNGDCIDTAGFLVGHAERTVMANITTENSKAQFPVAQVNARAHARAHLYDMKQLSRIRFDETKRKKQHIVYYCTYCFVSLFI